MMHPVTILFIICMIKKLLHIVPLVYALYQTKKLICIKKFDKQKKSGYVNMQLITAAEAAGRIAEF